MKKIILLLLCGVLLCGCSHGSKKERTVFSMDTHINMTVYGRCSNKTLDAAEAEIKRINDKFGIGNVSKAVASPDEETKQLLDFAEKIKKNTNGAFDVGVAPIMRIWGFYSGEFSEKNHRVPTQDEINEALLAAREGIYLDFGGIAKGYCADRLVEQLKDNGVKSAVLSLGGNVALIGTPPHGEEWTVGIQSPFDDGIYATIFAHDKTIVTSGDYMRYFETNGKKYHHIINPETGYPVENDITSVTVIADSATYADSMSTGLFVMGKDSAIRHWKEHRDFDMVIITKDGKIHYTDGLNIQTDYETYIIKAQ